MKENQISEPVSNEHKEVEPKEVLLNPVVFAPQEIKPLVKHEFKTDGKPEEKVSVIHHAENHPEGPTTSIEQPAFNVNGLRTIYEVNELVSSRTFLRTLEQDLITAVEDAYTRVDPSDAEALLPRKSKNNITRGRF